MTVKDILDRIADADKYLKKHKDPKTGEGVWQMTYEQRGRMVHELKRRADNGDKAALSAHRKVAR